GLCSAAGLRGTVYQLFRLSLGQAQLLLSILMCFAADLFGVLLSLLACLAEYTLGNCTRLLLGVLLYALRRFTGCLVLFQFFCGLFAITVSRVHISLYGAMFPFHLVLTVCEVALPVLLLRVADKVQRLVVSFGDVQFHWIAKAVHVFAQASLRINELLLARYLFALLRAVFVPHCLVRVVSNTRPTTQL